MNVSRPLVVAALCATLLAGCGDDAEPKFSPPSTSPTASESPSSSASAEPESAEDFIKHWVNLQTQMQNQGDTKEFRSVSRRCESCLATADTVDRFYKHGGYVETQGWRIKKIVCQGDASHPQCQVSVYSTPTNYREASAKPEEHLEGGPLIMIFRPKLTMDRWTLAGLTQQAT